MAQQTTLDMATAAENTTNDADADADAGTGTETKNLDEVLEGRALDGLTENMDIHEGDYDNPFAFDIHSASGSEYEQVELDPDNPAGFGHHSGTCPDFNIRMKNEGRKNGMCKHLQALAYATGRRAIPKEATREEINDDILAVLGKWVVKHPDEVKPEAKARYKELVF